MFYQGQENYYFPFLFRSAKILTWSLTNSWYINIWFINIWFINNMMLVYTHMVDKQHDVSIFVTEQPWPFSCSRHVFLCSSSSSFNFSFFLQSCFSRVKVFLRLQAHVNIYLVSKNFAYWVFLTSPVHPEEIWNQGRSRGFGWQTRYLVWKTYQI